MGKINSLSRVLAMTAALVMGAAGVAHAQVSCGDVITEDRVMDSDLNCPGHDPAITIVGAELDMNGYKLSGCPGVGILLTLDKSTVKNGSVIHCDTGVQLEGLGKHRVENMFVGGHLDYGVHIIAGADKNKLVNVTASVNGTGFRILSDKNSFDRCAAHTNGLDGFHTPGSTQGNTFTDSTATANGGDGFYVIASTVQRCHATYNGGDGFFGSFNTVKDSTSSSNVGNGFTLSDSKLVRCVASRNQKIGFSFFSDSTATKGASVANLQHGVYLGHDSSIKDMDVRANIGHGVYSVFQGNSVDGCNITNNGEDGIHNDAVLFSASKNAVLFHGTDLVDTVGSCASNEWKKNTFGTKNQFCIE